MMKPQDTRAKVLVVDDTETNIDILVCALGDEFEVSVAMDGKTALQCVAEVMPDLILLDIMMPEMDGYEVCRRLKADKAARDIPVIFLTAFSLDSAEETGLSLGAIDYVTKPFNPALVKARVRNHVALRRSQLDTIRQRDHLETAYQSLRELEKMRDDLVNLVVHDMRSPLMSILGYLELALVAKAEGPGLTREEFVRRSMDSARRLSDMVTSLLDVSRLEAGQMPLKCADCDIRELAEAVVKRLGGLAEGRNLSVKSPNTPALSHCDPEIIQRVVQNLLGNALKFTPVEGSITIEIAPEEQWTRFSVTDTGPGIPREHHDKVFQKFGQVAMRNDGQPSTGLGLTFCRLAVEAHGGSIQMDSEPGRGTAFHVRLPIASQAGAAQAGAEGPDRTESPKAAREQVLQQELRILLVDDERSVTDSVKRYLEHHTRWPVTAINNPEQAIRAALDLEPSLIVLDVDMPRMMGTDISEELKRFPSLSKTPVVFFTGLVRAEEVGASGFRKKGNYPLIPKGLPMARLLDVLVSLLSSRKAEDSPAISHA